MAYGLTRVGRANIRSSMWSATCVGPVASCCRLRAGQEVMRPCAEVDAGLHSIYWGQPT